MNISNEKKTTIIHSIIWAVLILVLAFLIKGNEQTNIIFTFMIAGWYISHASNIKRIKSTTSDSTIKKSSKKCCLT
jgi:preprotein translocase subunit SecG